MTQCLIFVFSDELWFLRLVLWSILPKCWFILDKVCFRLKWKGWVEDENNVTNTRWKVEKIQSSSRNRHVHENIYIVGPYYYIPESWSILDRVCFRLKWKGWVEEENNVTNTRWKVEKVRSSSRNRDFHENTYIVGPYYRKCWSILDRVCFRLKW